MICGQEYPWVLSASDDQTIRIWNWQSRTCIRCVCVFACLFSLTVFVCFLIFLVHCLCLSLGLAGSLSVLVSVSVFVCLSWFQSLCLSVCLGFSLCVCLSVLVSVSVFAWLCFCAVCVLSEFRQGSSGICCRSMERRRVNTF